MRLRTRFVPWHVPEWVFLAALFVVLPITIIVVVFRHRHRRDHDRFQRIVLESVRDASGQGNSVCGGGFGEGWR